jgi:hypothetical protein
MSIMSAIPGYLNLNELAIRLGVCYSQAARYVQHGALPSVAVGNSKLIPVSALDDFEKKPRGNPAFRKKTSKRKKAS